MWSQRKTVAEMRKLKTERPISMLYVDRLDEAEAASLAGIDMLSIPADYWSPQMRLAAGSCFVQVGLLYGDYCTAEDYLRGAHKVLRDGADAVYCCPSLKTIEMLSGEGIPVVGHAGLIPAKATWTGGFRAVGKTAEAARAVFRQVKDLETAGAFAAEIEVVAERVATAICARTSLILLSMGAGAGCHAQYLFAEDILGYTRGHRPRHAKTYRNFKAEFDRLQEERIKAFKEYADDVLAARFPSEEHTVPISDAEYSEFVKSIG
jgi:3-methyl-2-oxobutanoate hydroxymethyltransferase